MLKVPCSPTGASPTPTARRSPALRCRSAETGGTERQNVTIRRGARRARVTAATGPSYGRGAGSPKGRRPDHCPRLARGTRSTRSRSVAMRAQDRATGPRSNLVASSASRQVASSPQWRGSESRTGNVRPLPVPSSLAKAGPPGPRSSGRWRAIRSRAPGTWPVGTPHRCSVTRGGLMSREPTDVPRRLAGRALAASGVELHEAAERERAPHVARQRVRIAELRLLDEPLATRPADLGLHLLLEARECQPGIEPEQFLGASVGRPRDPREGDRRRGERARDATRHRRH